VFVVHGSCVESGRSWCGSSVDGKKKKQRRSKEEAKKRETEKMIFL
jgi:hypothetical protein